MTLKDFFEENPKTALAFSGGVDSTYLLYAARESGADIHAYYVKSEFQPEFEFEDAKRLAAELGAEMTVIYLDVLGDPDVENNPKDRCYHCKKHVFRAIMERAEKDGYEIILDGTNASDDVAERPGYRALQEAGVLSPLRACGLTKADIRRIAEQNRLPVAHKPSYACLATRIPTGTRITPVLLQTTETAENALRGMGFQNFRIRYRGGAAKLELGKNEKKLWTDNRAQIKKLLLNYYTDVVCEQKERADE